MLMRYFYLVCFVFTCVLPKYFVLLIALTTSTVLSWLNIDRINFVIVIYRHNSFMSYRHLDKFHFVVNKLAEISC